MPSTGRLTTYNRLPVPLARAGARRDRPHPDSTGVTIRVDDGVAEGGEVSMFYDPMIAKLISWAPTRDEAIDAQIDALDAFQLDGISDNIDFLSALLQHPRFRAGELTTGFIAEEYPDGFHGAPADEQLIDRSRRDRRRSSQLTHATRAALIDGQLGEPEYPEATQIVRIGKRDFAVTIAPYDGGTLVIRRRRRRDRRDRRLGAGQPLLVGRHGWAQARGPGGAQGPRLAADDARRRAPRARSCRAMSPS